MELELDNVRDKLKEAEAQCKALSDQNDLLEHKCAKLDRELAKVNESCYWALFTSPSEPSLKPATLH